MMHITEGDPAASHSPVHLLDATIKDTNVDAATDIDESILEGEYQVAKGVLFSTTH